MTAVAMVARLCLVILFPFSGLDKIVHWDQAIKQAESSPLGGARYMMIGGIIIEFATPVCIVLLWHAVIAALVLSVFCVATAVLFHPFWKFPGFWSGGNTEGAAHFWDFLKNFGLVGGLLLIVVAAPVLPASRHVTHHAVPAPHTPARTAPKTDTRRGP